MDNDVLYGANNCFLSAITGNDESNSRSSLHPHLTPDGTGSATFDLETMGCNLDTHNLQIGGAQRYVRRLVDRDGLGLKALHAN